MEGIVFEDGKDVFKNLKVLLVKRVQEQILLIISVVSIEIEISQLVVCHFGAHQWLRSKYFLGCCLRCPLLPQSKLPIVS